MRMRRVSLLALTCVGALALFTALPLAQPRGAAPQLVGAWQLETRTVERSDGTVLSDPVLGEKPLGRLFYDASGVMMLQMMRQGRTTPISTPANPRDAGNPRVVLGYD